MIVRYLGARIIKSTGCSSCGSRRVVDYGLQPILHEILPSGCRITFRLGETQEVSQSDGEYLLRRTYSNKGSEFPIFEEVKADGIS